MIKFFRIVVLLSGILALPGSLPAQVITIAQARSLAPGTTVTVQGTVTNGPALGKIRYLQDGTAGIAAYPDQGSPAGVAAPKPGDSIEISGILKVYENLLEISPITACRLLASDRPMPIPTLITIADIGPRYEGQLVRIDSLRFDEQQDHFEDGTLQVMDQAGNKSQVYIRPGSALIGAPLPTQPIPLVAILSRYKAFQLLPLYFGDFTPPDSKNAIYLSSSTVTTTLIVRGCKSGKIMVKDAADKEVLFTIVSSSGTTQLDVETLPAGAYVAVVQVKGQLTMLPFQKN